MAIYLGSTEIASGANIYLGSTEIQKVYLGSTQVWENRLAGAFEVTQSGYGGGDNAGGSGSVSLSINPGADYTNRMCYLLVMLRSSSATWSTSEITGSTPDSNISETRRRSDTQDTYNRQASFEIDLTNYVGTSNFTFTLDTESGGWSDYCYAYIVVPKSQWVADNASYDISPASMTIGITSAADNNLFLSLFGAGKLGNDVEHEAATATDTLTTTFSGSTSDEKTDIVESALVAGNEVIYAAGHARAVGAASNVTATASGSYTNSPEGWTMMMEIGEV